MGYPLGHLAKWSPFRLDALGLVTLFGAEEVSTAIGALQRNRYTEFLPLLGSFLVAEDKFTTPLPGFTLYNISDGAYVPVISGWFSRWLIANFRSSKKRALLKFEASNHTRYLEATDMIAIAIGAVGNGGLIAVASLQGDYYGIANAAAMLASVLVRFRMIHKKKRILGGRASKAEEDPDQDFVKIVISTPEDNVAISKIPRKFLRLIVPDLSASSRGITRGLGWVAFAVHVVCIGQSYLLSQLLSVALIAIATYLTIVRIGNDCEEAGGKLRIKSDLVGPQRREVLLSLAPTRKEELVLQRYWQLPCSMEDAEAQKWSSEFWGSWNKNEGIQKRTEGKEITASPTPEGV